VAREHPTTAERSTQPRGLRWSPGRIGELVAFHRKQRRLKVSELARSVGVTPSLISQIERGTAGPSVGTLFALAEALDISLDVFADRNVEGEARRASDEHVLAPSREGRYVVRKPDRRSITVAGDVRWELLSPGADQEIEFLEIVYDGHAESGATLYRHPGKELLLVLEGTFDVHVGFEVFRLEQGDSIVFPASQPHRYVNPAATPTRAITVIVPDPPLPAAPHAREEPRQVNHA
jgi:transcriptional regulator with XRE-family HTH domain